MISKRLHIIILLAFGSYICQGQISPGELTTAHAEIEGISNCTQCHDLGKKVSNTKCLDCHSEIQSLVDQNRGFHAGSDVRAQDCFACHSEHHGRKFDMLRFDELAFDHNLTGYELEGQHFVIDCRACHIPDYIADLEISKRENTFLGLDQECLSCHDDFHQGSLDNNCVVCHDFEAFRPAPGFNHDETEFVLRGAHINVDCIECHQMEERNGLEYQAFSDIPFADCVSCHDDPHQFDFRSSCIECHNETSFADVTENRFNHSMTDFQLEGSHAAVSCFECHTNTNDVSLIFQDQKGVVENDCISCHVDIHEGKFGTSCVDCHSTESFLLLKDSDLFDHNLTDYPLEGMHVHVDCKLCHTDRYTDEINFSQCKNCHDDYHNGEFVDKGISPDCIECHSLEEGFSYTLFGIDEHQESAFPLEGAHLATPCFSCHVSEDHWTFRDIGLACIDCHDDIHKDKIDPRFYPDNNCLTCHSSESWTAISFDHKQTDWPLTGQHVEEDCRACHLETVSDDQGFDRLDFASNQIFNTLQCDCITCHENVHGGQFAVEGITNCTDCHVTQNWEPINFDHNQTAFKLEGKHAEISCAECHEPYEENGVEKVNYKMESFECIDCHQ